MSEAVFSIYDGDYNVLVSGTQAELEGVGIVLSAVVEQL